MSYVHGALPKREARFSAVRTATSAASSQCSPGIRKTLSLNCLTKRNAYPWSGPGWPVPS